MNITTLCEPRSGVTTALTTVMPLTKLGVSSTGATTTYAVNTVTDATAWDLSTLTAGEIARGIWAVTADGYRGRVKSADDAANVVTVEYWVNSGGRRIPEQSSGHPTNAGVCTFHRVSFCKKIVITGIEANSVIIYSAFNSALPNDGSDGDEISATSANPNAVKVYEAPEHYFLDMTKLYINCASASQKLSWYAM